MTSLMPWVKQAPVSNEIPGWLTREPEQDYHAKRTKFLSSHQLSDFRQRGAFYFQQKRLGKIKDIDRPAFAMGRATHCIILEGEEEFQKRYFVGEGPVNPKTEKPFGTETQKYAEWLSEIGRPVLTPDQGALLWSMACSVRAHETAKKLLSVGLPEGVVRVTYQGEPCQGRLDWFNPSMGIVDLKTCDQLDYFEADARRYQYVHQMAFYRALVACASGHEYPVYMIAVEKKEPFRSGVWELDPGVLGVACSENEQAMQSIQACRTVNHWPTGYETVRQFNWI